MSIMLKEKRLTRGKRMNALIGKAAEEDDAFWGANDTIWDAEDESFSEEDNKDEPDEVILPCIIHTLIYYTYNHVFNIV